MDVTVELVRRDAAIAVPIDGGPSRLQAVNLECVVELGMNLLLRKRTILIRVKQPKGRGRARNPQEIRQSEAGVDRRHSLVVSSPHLRDLDERSTAPQLGGNRTQTGAFPAGNLSSCT